MFLIIGRLVSMKMAKPVKLQQILENLFDFG